MAAPSSSTIPKGSLNRPELPTANQQPASQKRKSPHDGLMGGELGKHNLRPTRDAVLSNVQLDRPPKRVRNTHCEEEEAAAASSSSQSPSLNRVPEKSQQGSVPIGEIIASYLKRPSTQFTADQLKLLQMGNILTKATLADSQASDQETGLELENKAGETREVNRVVDADDRSLSQSRQSLASEGTDGDTDTSTKSARHISDGSLSSGLFEDFPHDTPSTSYSSQYPKFPIPQQLSQTTNIGSKGKEREKENVAGSERDFQSLSFPSILTEHLEDDNKERSEQDEPEGEDELLQTINDASASPQSTVTEKPLRETQTRTLLPPSIPQDLSPSSTSDGNGSSPRDESMDPASPLASVKAPELDRDTGIFSKMAVIVFPKGPKKKYDTPEHRRPAIATLDTAADVNAISTNYAHQLAELGLEIVKLDKGFEVKGIGGHMVSIEEGVKLTCEWQGRSKAYDFYLIESDAFELLWGHKTLKEERIYKKESSGQLFIATGKKRKEMTKGTRSPVNLPRFRAMLTVVMQPRRSIKQSNKN
jgi:hypothetical protein